MNSALANFRNLTPEGRRAALVDAGVAPDVVDALARPDALTETRADGMIENVMGRFALPMGIATNFRVNGKDHLIPMAVEEPSVVAAASHMAKLARTGGGFAATCTDPVMRAQVQILGLDDLADAAARLEAVRDRIIDRANGCDPVLVSLGGGCRGIELHRFEDSPVGRMLVMHLLVDVRDAMGANAVNTMAETLAPFVEEVTGGEVRLRILSNLADQRLATSTVAIPVAAMAMGELAGADVARRIVEAAALAVVDPYRAATHNKGIMNGIDPVVLATGNDWRAIEAGAHAFAAQGGRYTALSTWEVRGDTLHGRITLPMALGLVGGATRSHPAAQAALALMQVGSAQDLAGIVAAVGLAQNLAALRALATEGIQKGHMALHARNIAIAAGAVGADVDRVAKALVAGGDMSAAAARALVSGDQT